jgi:hypothetical protein
MNNLKIDEAWNQNQTLVWTKCSFLQMYICTYVPTYVAGHYHNTLKQTLIWVAWLSLIYLSKYFLHKQSSE